MAHLSDDGTMDTVIVCDRCGQEHRFSYSGGMDWPEPESHEDSERQYAEWIQECCAEVDEECDCQEEA